MSFKNFTAFFRVLIWEVEISWALSGVFYAVVGSLGHNWEGAAVSKEFLVRLVGIGGPAGKKRGRAAPFQTKSFDCTMGFPGEDVTVHLNNELSLLLFSFCYFSNSFV